MAALSLHDIGKTYADGTPVLRGVTLDIADGEFCVFVGPSGCGKSTLLRMIAGLEDISGGDLAIGGVRVNDKAPASRDVAMVFQNYALYPHMDVAANLGFGLRLAGVTRADAATRVRSVARTLEIEPLLARRPKELSGGQRQRVAIGRALVREPGVFLFDEPLSNLDAALRTQTRLEIARLHRAYGRASTVYVTHDQVEAMTLADRMVLLQPLAGSGRPSIAQAGRPLDLYHAPCNRFVAGFLGSPRMNFLDAEMSGIEAGAVRVRLAGGAEITIDADAGALRPGDAASIGVRAEHLRLHAAPGPNRIACSVQWLEHLGDQSLAYLDGAASPQPLAARLPDGTRAALGDAVHAEIPRQRAHLFDAAGQARPRPR